MSKNLFTWFMIDHKLKRGQGDHYLTTKSQHGWLDLYILKGQKNNSLVRAHPMYNDSVNPFIMYVTPSLELKIFTNFLSLNIFKSMHI